MQRQCTRKLHSRFSAILELYWYVSICEVAFLLQLKAAVTRARVVMAEHVWIHRVHFSASVLKVLLELAAKVRITNDMKKNV